MASVREYDGLGRETKSRVSTGTGDGEICAEKQYDGIGRLWRTSNPEKNCGAGQYWTVTAYDGLDRVLRVTVPDGSVTKSEYEGSRTLATDAEGKTRRTRVDGAGRVVEVRENEKSWRVASVGIATELMYTTSYAYNGRDQLTQVTQEGSGARSFIYDTAGRLVQATEPEWNGPTLYRYDGSGNLVYKRDARNVVTNIGYDWLNRALSKSYTGGTASAPPAIWCYDGKVWNGSACADSVIANAKGRLTQVWSGDLASGSETKMTGFDAAGRVLSSVQKTLRIPV